MTESDIAARIAVPKNSIRRYRVIDFVLRSVLRWLPVNHFTRGLALWWGYRFRPNPATIRLRSGVLIKTERVDHINLLLYYLGTFEPHALATMCRHVKVGDTILDVGANIGLFTLEGAQAVGQSGKVIAIEAAPFLAESLRSNAQLNNLSNVQIITHAVGDGDGEAIMTLPRNANYGSFTLGRVSGDVNFSVRISRIDDLVGDRRVDFIKMDIEGSELKALKGAHKVLTRNKPSILIELNEQALNGCGASSREVKQVLFDYGYRGFMAETLAPIALDQSHGCDECIFVAQGLDP